uniref:Uncharacterized protein n=1 Tax=Rhizophora mucronata TaxID=61149 RepID=A0A2P2NXB0_RHIMU
MTSQRMQTIVINFSVIF